MMLVPLIARGVVLGLGTLYRSRPVGPFTDDDVSLAGELAARAAICVDNARLYRREHDTALVLQRSLFPQHIPHLPQMVAHRYLPASDVNEVGGDWYDVIRLNGGKAALAIGDVMDTAPRPQPSWDGSPPASAHWHGSTSPENLLHQLEAALEDLTEPMLATFLYTVIDPANGRCHITRAGHPPPAACSPTAPPAPPRRATRCPTRRRRHLPSPPPMSASHPAASSSCTPTGSSRPAAAACDERLAQNSPTSSNNPPDPGRAVRPPVRPPDRPPPSTTTSHSSPPASTPAPFEPRPRTRATTPGAESRDT